MLPYIHIYNMHIFGGAEPVLDAENNIAAEDANGTNAKDIRNVIKYADSKRDHLFLFIYATYCGYCKDAYKPWMAFEKKVSSVDGVRIYAIENTLFSGVGTDVFDGAIGESPNGFPAFRHVHNGKVTDYVGDRTTTEFEKWVQSKTDKTGGMRDMNDMRGMHNMSGISGMSDMHNMRGGGRSRRSRRSKRSKQPSSLSARRGRARRARTSRRSNKSRKDSSRKNSSRKDSSRKDSSRKRKRKKSSRKRQKR
jgi:hypothetical protein